MQRNSGLGGGAVAPAARRDAQRGFTLVEMAIVLVIIGLIIGGVLKGQEIVDSGRVKTQVSQVDNIKAAVTTFQDQYGYFPGDFQASKFFIPGAKSTWDGDQDGFVAQTGASTPILESAGVGNEMGFAWVQLTYANLLGGASIPLTGSLPSFAAKISGGILYWGDFTYTATGQTPGTILGQFVRIQGNATQAAPTHIMRTIDAFQIDSKYDDGSPSSGTILASSASDTNCCGGTACTAANTYTGTTGGAANNSGLFCVLMWQTN